MADFDVEMGRANFVGGDVKLADGQTRNPSHEDSHTAQIGNRSGVNFAEA